MKDYGSLRQAVMRWLDRSDTATINMIPQFIYLAEKQIFRMLLSDDIPVPSYENEIEVSVYPYTNFIDIPADFIRMSYVYLPEYYRDLNQTTYKNLLDKISEGGPDGIKLTGIPTHYARHIRRLYFYPTPPTKEYANDLNIKEYETIKIRLVYNRDPTVFREDSESSYLLTVAPDLLLFTALAYGADFIKDLELKANYDQKAGAAYAMLKQQLELSDMGDSKYLETQYY